MSDNHWNEVKKNKQQLLEKVEEKPEKVRTELLQHLKPVIDLGNKTGENVEPEKKLYLKAKMSKGNPEKLQKALKEWRKEE